MRKGGAALVVTGVLLAGVLAGVAEAAGPSAEERVVEALKLLAPFQLGADRQGDLWAWSRDGGKVVLFDREGREKQTWRASAARAVDVDGEWGVVALGSRGRELLRPGTGAAPVPLQHEAGNVAWIDATRVAVLPILAAHRVEILDLASSRIVQQLDEVGPVPAGPGARVARATEVEVDPDTGHLYVLDSFSGELEIYDPEAPAGTQRLQRIAVPDDGRKVFDDWLQRSDERARREGSVQRPVVWRFQMGRGPDGGAWISRPCGDQNAVARLFRVTSDGEAKALEVETPCCSTEFAIWHGRLVFHRPSSPAMDGCSGTTKLP